MPAPDPAAIAQVQEGLGPDPPREGEPRLLLTQQPSLKRRELYVSLTYRLEAECHPVQSQGLVGPVAQQDEAGGSGRQEKLAMSGAAQRGPGGGGRDPKREVEIMQSMKAVHIVDLPTNKEGDWMFDSETRREERREEEEVEERKE
ncbi:hypothetical protein H920_17581 [Fukomys damarensis]|uniref:Uncharacterized protein n=1 Tax=Fukomys damarensis TaxID=885580 RepID=A0A091CSZ1_FUKDA|nr:hypothetical protein H920_17581 [Fukomys damarensis]